MRAMTVYQMKKILEKLPDEIHITDYRLEIWYNALDDKDKYKGIKEYKDLPVIREGSAPQEEEDTVYNEEEVVCNKTQEEYKPLSDMLKEYRAKTGVSQRELAQRCGVSNTLISVLEREINPQTNKRMSPSIETYSKIAKGTGIPLQRLIGGQ